MKKELEEHTAFLMKTQNIYHESHRKLEVVNEMIVKASMETRMCYGVTKYAEIVFRKR